VIHTGDVTVDSAAVEADLSYCAGLLNELGSAGARCPHDVGDAPHVRQPAVAERLALWRRYLRPDRWVEDVGRRDERMAPNRDRRGSEALTRLGTESLQTPRWREVDSKFQYAGTVHPSSPLLCRPIARGGSARLSVFGPPSRPASKARGISTPGVHLRQEFALLLAGRSGKGPLIEPRAGARFGGGNWPSW
jgi:hypothetical protein